MHLIDIWGAFHPKTAEYKFFSSVHGSFLKRDHMLGNKASLNKLKKIEIITSTTIIADSCMGQCWARAWKTNSECSLLPSRNSQLLEQNHILQP